MRRMVAANLLAMVLAIVLSMGGMLASAPARAAWVPAFKGNETGGIIA